MHRGFADLDGSRQLAVRALAASVLLWELVRLGNISIRRASDIAWYTTVASNMVA